MHVCACVYTNPVILLFFCDSHIASPLHPSLYFHLEFPLKIKLHQKRWTKVLPLLSVHITNKTLILCEPSGQPIQLWSVGKMWPSFFCYFISSVLRERSRKTGAIIHMQFHIISWLIFYARYAHVAASLSIFSKRARWHSENIGKLLLICFGILQKTEVETSGGVSWHVHVESAVWLTSCRPVMGFAESLWFPNAVLDFLPSLLQQWINWSYRHEELPEIPQVKTGGCMQYTVYSFTLLCVNADQI